MTLKVWCPSRSAQARRLVQLARKFAAVLGVGSAELSLTLVRDSTIRKLKHQYFGVDAATDVLSFPAGEFPGPGPRPLGDIVISIDTARRAATEFDSSIAGALALYLAHGFLHLFARDFETPREARQMERLERQLLGHAGMLARSDDLDASAGRR